MCFSNILYVFVFFLFNRVVVSALRLYVGLLGSHSSYCILFKCQRVCAAVCEKLNDDELEISEEKESIQEREGK